MNISVLKAQSKEHECFIASNHYQPVIHLKGFGKYLNYNDKYIQDNADMCVQTICQILIRNHGGTIVWDGDSYSTQSFTKLIPIIFRKCKEHCHQNHSSNGGSHNNDTKTNDKHSSANKQSIFNLNMCAFIRSQPKTEVKRFLKSWKTNPKLFDADEDEDEDEDDEDENSNIVNDNEKHRACFQCVFLLQPLSDIQDFIELGVYSLRLTQSTMVFCFGGGFVVRKEYEMFAELFMHQNQKHNTHKTANSMEIEDEQQQPQKSALCLQLSRLVYYVFDISRFNQSQNQIEQSSLKQLFMLQHNSKNVNNFSNIRLFDTQRNSFCHL